LRVVSQGWAPPVDCGKKYERILVQPKKKKKGGGGEGGGMNLRSAVFAD